MGNKSESSGGKSGGLGGMLKRILGGGSKTEAGNKDKKTDNKKSQHLKEPAPPAPKAAKKPSTAGGTSRTSRVSRASSKSLAKPGVKPSKIKLSHSKLENLTKPAVTAAKFSKQAPKSLAPPTRQKGKDFPII